MDEKERLKKLRALLDSGLQNYLTGDYTEAIRDLKAAEVLDHQNPETLYNLGLSYSRLGLHKSALDYLYRVIELPFDFVEELTVRTVLALTLIHLGEYLEAQEQLDRVLSVDRTNRAASNLKAYGLYQQKKIDEAVDQYRRILAREPDNATAANSLAYLLVSEKGETVESQELVKKSLEKYPANPAYLDTLGYILLKLGDYENARKVLEKARESAPLEDEILEHQKELQDRFTS
jgi:tetratricopeptide (TPR) repeat protein